VVVDEIYRAQSKGFNVAFDTIPDMWGPGPVASLLPPDVVEASPAQVLQRLQDPAVREDIEDYFARPTNYLLQCAGWEGLILTYAPCNEQWVGKSLAEIADASGNTRYADVVCEILVAEGEDFANVFLRHIYARQEDLDRLVAEPVCAFMSDGAVAAPYGPLADFVLTPMTYGFTAHVVEEYVRERELLSTEEAIRRMTSLPAVILGLNDRGVICEGNWADLAVLDLESLKDLSSLEAPRRYPAGVRYVLVNGRVVLTGAGQTGTLPGHLVGSGH
jgi:N-acyl-D-amino-acid deacylase